MKLFTDTYSFVLASGGTVSDGGYVCGLLIGMAVAIGVIALFARKR